MSIAPSISEPPRSAAWIWQVTLLSIVLGVLLALSLQTQHHITSHGLPPRYQALASRYFELESMNKSYTKEIQSLRGDTIPKLESALKASAQNETGSTQVNALSKQLEELRMFAGLSAVQGPGIVVVLSDSPDRDRLAKRLAGGNDQGPDYQQQMMNYLVHDQDIVGVVNELKNAGAEAISVNGQRIVATTSIRCVGPVCLINRKAAGGAAPYTVTAIGSTRDLEDGLKLPGGYLDQQQLMAYHMVSIQRKDKVVVPAFEGATLFDFAKPAPATVQTASAH